MEKILIFFIINLFFMNAIAYAYADSDSIKIPLQTASVSLDPSHIQDTSSLFVSRQLNCQLVRSYGSIYKLEAAKSIKYISPLEIMIKISNDAKFYDDTSITSEDVVASFNHIKKTRNVLRNMFSWVNDIIIVDNKTIIFKLKKPIPQFIKVLASPHNAIFKKSFLDLVEKNQASWTHPIGCGGYKISASNDKEINLVPIKEGLKLTFFLNTKNQLAADSINKYDLISVEIAGYSDAIKNFNKIEIFDPRQIFIGLNAKNPGWKNKSDRCSFLSKLNNENLLNVYGGRAKVANDFLPAGMFGYDKNANYFLAVMNSYIKRTVPQEHNFCLAYLTVSIPEKYVGDYKNMIQKIYPKVTAKPISDYRQFGFKFSDSNCDAIVFAFKSNNLEGYEYIDLFANKDANFSGIYDANLANQIKSSQDITDPALRMREYREIIQKIENLCVIRPLLTVQMQNVYVHKSLSAPDIGVDALNNYYLGNVKRIGIQ